LSVYSLVLGFSYKKLDFPKVYIADEDPVVATYLVYANILGFIIISLSKNYCLCFYT